MKTGMNGTRPEKYWYRMMLGELAFVAGTSATDSTTRPTGTRNDQCRRRVGSARRSPRMSSGRIDDRAAPKMLARPGVLGAGLEEVDERVARPGDPAGSASSSTAASGSMGSDSPIDAR